MEQFQVVSGGVAAAKGFQTASTAAGIKYKDRPDRAMIYSEQDCPPGRNLYDQCGEGGSGPVGQSFGGGWKMRPGGGHQRRHRPTPDRERGDGLL